MSDSQVRDESPFAIDDQLMSYRTEFIPIGSLLPADSPRLTGEIEEHTRTLAESEAPLPPIVVHRPTMRIVDGMHRLRAAALRGQKNIEVRFIDGSPEDVFVLAVKLNAEHGMPLSRNDRVAAATRIIESHPHWSDRRIAVVTCLSPSLVASLRTRSDGTVAQLTLRTGRDGRRRPVNGAAGRIAASRVIAETPDASLREIASKAGVAVATARDVRERMRLGQDPVPPKLRLAERANGACRSETREPEDPDRPAPPPPPVISERVLSSMRRDPSLRMTEMGRALLHLLGNHLLSPEQRQSLVDGVPSHRAADVVRAARMVAEQWLQFANDVELRSTEAQDMAREIGRVHSFYASSTPDRVRG
ncbi:ParB/RepB/Spo0J family partition protein [Streptomyces sp. NBC_01803]|uniref:ParB/RepB/Spo0J family partition protein n=1 Tax=Streptomyces sp. NBC_01803 TaxID=2975946 RepID=UPI002DD88573|nr:ParB/RepB/Spo0J family partition protein [Streptomyces sp. NBC_01803]WSA43070.1 ParB/RepB/Spo0J family partition protein [Streptomyces sp. NBC_01803]